MECIIREGALRLELEKTCDVVLCCHGGRLMAHKLILSIASPVLHNLFLDDLCEPTTLILPDINFHTMSSILDYIYTGSVYIYSNYLQDFMNIATLLSIKFDFVPRREDKVRVKTLRKLPNLVPLKSLPKKKRPGGHIIPSPWCPRDEPVLEDPRKDYEFYQKNDTNNNFQYSSQTINFSNDSPECSGDLYDGKASNSSAGDGEEAVKREETITEVKRKPFECVDCGKCFSQLRNYKYHRSIHEGTKEFAAKCPECGKLFNDKGYLSSHMKIHRDRKEYACPHCPKRFNQRVAYNMHLRIHTGIKPHQCNICNKSFSRKMLLKQHQRVHTGERPYSCPECGKTFADRSNMSLHARLHTGVKPYTCNLCSKSFTKKHHLKTHMNFHTGLKPYSCQKCGLAFSQSSNMRTHYKKCVLKDANTNTTQCSTSSNTENTTENHSNT